jgi:Protein of unknown function (DUF3089)
MTKLLSALLLATSVSMLCASLAYANDQAVPGTVAPTNAVASAPQAETGTDYRIDRHWLCRPGRDDICAQPLTAVSTGDAVVQTLRANPAAAIDCFYIYPTISYDASANSDLDAGPEERRAAQHQFAAFGSECRLFAPVYRQVTLAALRSRFTGAPMQPSAQMAYGDVRDAWADYLARDNQGRGVVLIGHSQGARMLANLIAREIEGKPAQSRIVAALLLGTNIAVPKAADVGGDFKSMPLCRSAAQLGCVIAYAAFRADAPPPADTLFGRLGSNAAVGAADPAVSTVACTNPAALAGGPGTLNALLPLRENLLGQPTTAGAWGARGQATTATFLAWPQLAAECVEADGASYLSVRLPAEVPGDVTFNNQILRNWGLHLIDANLALGNLVQVVREKARAYGTR